MSKQRILHYIVNKELSLANTLSNLCDIDSKKAELLCQLGAIYINRERITNDQHLLKTNDYLRVHIEPKRFSEKIKKTDLVFENSDFVVINKPAGLPCHPTLDNILENSLTQAEQIIGTPLYVTNRLDQATEGLLVYAKNKNYQSYYNILLQQNRVEKTYIAIVEQSLKIIFDSSLINSTNPYRLTHYMKKDLRSPKQLALNNDSEFCLACLLDIIKIETTNMGQKLTIRLITGRTHQIRAQLAFIGSPIIGDSLYNSSLKEQSNKIKLKCTSLQFPDKENSDQCHQINISDHF